MNELIQCYNKKLTIQFGKIGRVQKVISGGRQEGGGIEPGDQWINTFICNKTSRSGVIEKDFS